LQFYNLPVPVLSYIFSNICDFAMYILSYAVVSWKKDNAKQKSSKSWIRNVFDLHPRNTQLENCGKSE
jgi:hypothetical protein